MVRHSSCKRSASVTKRRRALSRCRSQQCHLLFPPARRGRAGTGAPPAAQRRPEPPAALGSARRPLPPLTVGPQVPRAARARLPPPRRALQPSSSPRPLPRPPGGSCRGRGPAGSRHLVQQPLAGEPPAPALQLCVGASGVVHAAKPSLAAAYKSRGAGLTCNTTGAWQNKFYVHSINI